MPNITTTGGGNKPMVTTTDGGQTASPYAGMNIGDFLGKALAARQSMAAPQRAPQRMPIQPMERIRPMQAPQLGQASVPDSLERIQSKPINTRMRRVQKQMSIPSLGLSGKGLTWDEHEEKQLADGSWSLDAMYGTLAGNEEAARKRMDFLQNGPR